MKLVVRTKTFPVFQMFLKSFVLFYENRLDDLIVQVQIEGNNYIFYETYQKQIKKAYKKTFEIETIIISNKNTITNNYWAHMIYKSLQYDEVISMDDDIIFIKPGLFNYIDTIKHNSKILSFKYLLSSGEYIINSAFVYKRDIDITKNDFLSIEDVEKYEGVDTGLVYYNHKNDCKFIDNWIKTRYNNFSKNSVLTEYFLHLGGISCTYNIALNEVKKHI